MNLVACYVIWNEADSIVESLRSVKSFVDRFVVVDAVFASNPVDATHSTDRTREIVETICAAHPEKPLTYIESAAKLTEAYARNAYLEQLEPGDWALVIDGDEVLHGDWAAIRQVVHDIKAGYLRDSLAIPVYTVAVQAPKVAPAVLRVEYERSPLLSTMGYMPRLFAAKPDLRYTTPPHAVTPALTYTTPPSRYLIPRHHAEGREGPFLINNHVKQSYEGYQADWVWESNVE